MKLSGDVTASVVNPTSVTVSSDSTVSPMGDTGLDAKDAASVWVERAMPQDVDFEAQYPISDTNDAGIKEFLARPYLVASGTMAANDTATTLLCISRVPCLRLIFSRIRFAVSLLSSMM
jgi:hypothetical protein